MLQRQKKIRLGLSSTEVRVLLFSVHLHWLHISGVLYCCTMEPVTVVLSQWGKNLLYKHAFSHTHINDRQCRRKDPRSTEKSASLYFLTLLMPDCEVYH
jgi:hypothetical protein